MCCGLRATIRLKVPFPCNPFSRPLGLVITMRMIKSDRFSLKLNEIEFITWKQNDEDGSYWAKLHMPSGKELRQIFATRKELDSFIEEWSIEKEAKVTINIEEE
mgnify:CR=1 FL=1